MILSWVWQIVPTMAINDWEKWKCVNFCVNISLVTVKGRAKSKRDFTWGGSRGGSGQTHFLFVSKVKNARGVWSLLEVFLWSLTKIIFPLPESDLLPEWDLLLGRLQNQPCHKTVVMPTVPAGHALLWTMHFWGLEREESPALNTSFLPDPSLLL